MRNFLLLCLPLCVLTMLSGCTAQPGKPVAASSSAESDDHAAHAHPTEGPHHGDLVELGNEEYHGEVVHEAGKVTIYILDGAATAQVPIAAKEIMVNVMHDGKPEQFKLAATPDASDPADKSSRFVSSDAELAGHLDEEGSAPKLVLEINGKSYRGTITHSHDHDAHAGHAGHGEHAEHAHEGADGDAGHDEHEGHDHDGEGHEEHAGHDHDKKN